MVSGPYLMGEISTFKSSSSSYRKAFQCLRKLLMKEFVKSDNLYCCPTNLGLLPIEIEALRHRVRSQMEYNLLMTAIYQKQCFSDRAAQRCQFIKTVGGEARLQKVLPAQGPPNVHPSADWWSLPGHSRQASKDHSPRCHCRPNGPGRLADKVVQPTTQSAKGCAYPKIPIIFSFSNFALFVFAMQFQKFQVQKNGETDHFSDPDSVPSGVLDGAALGKGSPGHFS